jgi:NADH oxidase (H2O2-forming)
MTTTDIAILGGSAAGITAAITARRFHPDKQILLVRREQQVPIPCGIPYVYGTLESCDQNLIPDSILQKHRIDLHLADVTAIDRQNHRLLSNESDITYDRLVLATGTRAVQPPIPGVDLAGVYSINKDVSVLQQLSEELELAQNIVILGCGFIGIEFADEINKRGNKSVTVIEMAESCLNLSYDAEFCHEMQDHLRGRGIALRTSTVVKRIDGQERVQAVVVQEGEKIPADIVIIGIGAAPNVDLARDAEILLGPLGAVAVDRTMLTSDPTIFACGDCAEKVSFFGGRPSPLKLASIAQHEARIAGANLYTIRRESLGTIGVWSTAIGDLAMGTAGLTETAALKMGYRVICSTAETPNRHPGIMPGSALMKIKLVFDERTLVLLGGQIRGNASIGEMVNTIAACVQTRMTADTIARFQMGTHPALTASPIVYPLINAAEEALRH